MYYVDWNAYQPVFVRVCVCVCVHVVCVSTYVCIYILVSEGIRINHNLATYVYTYIHMYVRMHTEAQMPLHHN